jgi:NTP pyrophosphatase (non-canonical NTP hydrolase)
MNLKHFSTVNLSRYLRWHPQGINSWTRSDWAVAMVGEAGEACNFIKKLNRLRDGLVGNRGEDADAELLRKKLGKEIADVVIYCDLMAQAEGLDLSTLIAEKFNEVSVRNGFPERV